MTARITSIETVEGSDTVNLEWGGPDDWQVYDFDIWRLGSVFRWGTNGNAGRTGWVVLRGFCKLKAGDSVPFVVRKPFKKNENLENKK